jgi:hypothetical protein
MSDNYFLRLCSDQKETNLHTEDLIATLRAENAKLREAGRAASMFLGDLCFDDVVLRRQHAQVIELLRAALADRAANA